MRSGKLSDWHEFNRRDPEISEFLEMRNYRVKGSFGRIGSNMQFVKDAVLKRSTLPVVVRPTEEIQVNDLGRAMNSLRLIAGRRVRQVSCIIEAIKILRVRSKPLGEGVEISVAQRFHANCMVTNARKNQAGASDLWRPDEKIPTAIRLPIRTHPRIFLINLDRGHWLPWNQHD